MMRRRRGNPDPKAAAAGDGPLSHRLGVVLLVTMVMLVVLATLAYTVTSRVAAHRHRVRYLIDYTKARYARDSALKYALTAVESLDLSLVSRPNEPDFSDLFAMSDEQVDQMLAKAEAAAKGSASGSSVTALKGLLGSAKEGADANRTQDGPRRDTNETTGSAWPADEPVVRGPYGPPWPWVTEPIEFEIGSVKVRIEIEDDNAKYPLGWMLLEDAAVQRPVNAGFATFCEWMGWTAGEIDSLKEQLAQVAEIKAFKLPSDQPAAASGGSSATRTSAAARQAAARAAPRRTNTKAVSPAERQTADLSRLVHSSLLDHELLSRPTIPSDKRKESLSKYIGLWGTAVVNVNSAPRHVLEAAFAFVGDAAPIAGAIIRQRQIQPLRDVADLRKTVTRYADSIEKDSKYITYASTTFTVRITATSGSARASAVAGVVREGKTVRVIGVISG